MNNKNVKLNKEQIADFCKRNHIIKLSFFGSILRDDFGPESDIDVLVEFNPKQIPGFLGLARMERELSSILGNRKVDLRTPQELSRHFRDEVVAAADVQYAKR